MTRLHVLGRCVLLAVLFAFFLGLRLYSGFDLGTEWVDADVGVRAAWAERVLDGELPYRDFWAHYPPLPYYINALLFRQFGEQLSSFRIGLALVGAATCFLAYVITRRLASRTAALSALVLCMSWSVVDLNISYNTWYCVPLCMGALWAALVGISTPKAWPWFVAGLFCGALLGLKLNYGVFVLTALGMVVLATGRRQSSPGLRAIHIGLLSLAGLGGLALIRQAVTPLTLANFGLPILACALWAATADGPSQRDARILPRLALLTVGACAPLVPFFVYFAVQWNFGQFLNAAFLQFIRYGGAVILEPARPDVRTIVVAACVLTGLLGAMRTRDRSQPLGTVWMTVGVCGVFAALAVPLPLHSSSGLWLFTLVKSWVHVRSFVPAAMVWAALAVLWRCRRDPEPVMGVFAVTVAAVAALLTLFPYSDVNHQQWCWPPVAVLACILLDGYLRNCGARARLLWLLPLGLAAVQAFALGTHFYRPETVGGPWQHKSMLLAAPPRGDVYAAEERAVAIQGAVAFIHANTAPNAPLLELYGHCLGFLAARPNPTRYDYFWPGWLNEDDQRSVIADLEAQPPPFIVGHKRGGQDEPLDRFAGYFPILGKFLRERYRPVRLIGPYQFYAARPAAA